MLRLPFGPLAGLWSRIAPYLGRDSILGFQTKLEEMGALTDPGRDAANLPFWVADAVMEPENDLPELVVARNRFMRRVRTSSDRLSDWNQSMHRARSLNSDHVLDHFTALTGYSLSEIEACGMTWFSVPLSMLEQEPG